MGSRLVHLADPDFWSCYSEVLDFQMRLLAVLVNISLYTLCSCAVWFFYFFAFLLVLKLWILWLQFSIFHFHSESKARAWGKLEDANPTSHKSGQVWYNSGVKDTLMNSFSWLYIVVLEYIFSVAFKFSMEKCTKPHIYFLLFFFFLPYETMHTPCCDTKLEIRVSVHCWVISFLSCWLS